MKEVEIIKSMGKLSIMWQGGIINIPLGDIEEINENIIIIDTTKLVTVGRQCSSLDTICIRTKRLNLLFTTNKFNLLNTIIF